MAQQSVNAVGPSTQGYPGQPVDPSTQGCPGQPVDPSTQGYSGHQYHPYQGAGKVRNARFQSKQALFLGVAQIVIGVLCIIFNITALGINEVIGVAGHGIWGGILFIITGSLGVGAAKNNSKCLINSFNVLCIISASMCLAVLALGIGGAANSGQYFYGYYSGHYYGCMEYSRSTRDYNSCMRGQIAMESLLAILAFIDAVFAIWGSAICCRAHCCCRCCKAEIRSHHDGMTTGVQMQVVMQQQQQQSYHQQMYPQPNYLPQNYPPQYYPPQNYPPPDYRMTSAYNVPLQNYNTQGYLPFGGYSGQQVGPRLPGYDQPSQSSNPVVPAYNSVQMPNTNISNSPDQNKQL